MEIIRPEPAYEQVARHLREALYRGEYVAGEKLPSSPDLAVQFGCSVPVVVRAFGRLKDEGLVRTAFGSATYAAVRHRYEVRVDVPWAGAAGGADLGALAAALVHAPAGEPALLAHPVVASGPCGARVVTIVECANWGQAARVVHRVLWRAAVPGWDVDAARATTRVRVT